MVDLEGWVRFGLVLRLVTGAFAMCSVFFIG